MTAFMIIAMEIHAEDWLAAYLPAVSALLEEHGAVVVAAGRNPTRIEGDAPQPDRVAVLSFPTLAAAAEFLNDDRYQPYRRMREAGSRSDIFVFDSSVRPDGRLK